MCWYVYKFYCTGTLWKIDELIWMCWLLHMVILVLLYRYMLLFVRACLAHMFLKQLLTCVMHVIYFLMSDIMSLFFNVRAVILLFIWILSQVFGVVCSYTQKLRNNLSLYIVRSCKSWELMQLFLEIITNLTVDCLISVYIYQMLSYLLNLLSMWAKFLSCAMITKYP